ncbi:hypothetical protein LSUE1_G005765 [Lachnellula suecica]|uniref:BTB domain-containing protein n=1 Tax=Lachnellula suecica TaxID=602035 RepID=A0A8T9C6Z8_9HELO|nr:hypothetical protein LSUE1_G005765 [Lachnellula suecica]
MSDKTPSQAVNKRSATSPDEGPRKKHKPNPPDFSEADKFVTFLIGPSEKTFLVHKEVVCYHSPVLSAAFNSAFVEGQTQTYTLDDTTEGAFKLLVQWFYGKKIQLQILQEEYKRSHQVYNEKIQDIIDQEHDDLLRLWVLADKFSIPTLQNLVMRKLNEISEWTYHIHFVGLGYIYLNTVKGSPLRKYFVEVIARELSSDHYKTDPEDFPKEMLLELAIFYSKRWHSSKSLKIERFMVPVPDVEDSGSSTEA